MLTKPSPCKTGTSARELSGDPNNAEKSDLSHESAHKVRIVRSYDSYRIDDVYAILVIND